MKRIDYLLALALIFKIIFPSVVFGTQSTIQPLEVDQTTGNANFAFPIDVPPGRNSAQYRLEI